MSNLVFPLAAIGAKIVSKDRLTSTRIDEAASSKETRTTWWLQPRYRYRLGFEILNQVTTKDLQRLAGFFGRHDGPLDSFLLLDTDDNAASAMGFGVGDGATTAFQLQRGQLGYTDDVTGGPWLTVSTPRMNLALQSETLDNATWTKFAASVSANAGTAPDGTTTADKLIDTVATSDHETYQSLSTTSGVAYTWSVWAKAAGRTQIAARRNSSVSSVFDLSSGTVVSNAGGASGSIYAHPTLAGWYRCATTFTASSTGALAQQITLANGGVTNYLGDGASGVLLWGAVFEASAGVGPYLTPGTNAASLVTTAAAVTATPSYWPSFTADFEPLTEIAPGPAISVAGVLKTLTTDYTLSSTGVVTFVSAPASGAALTWTGNFYRRCRFEDDTLSLERLGLAMFASQLSLLSVK